MAGDKPEKASVAGSPAPADYSPRNPAPVLRSVMMQMLKERPGYPKGFLVAVPSGLFNAVTGDLIELTGTAKLWQGEKAAAPVVVPLPGQSGEEPLPEVKIILCADKIFDSPALYPGDCFGADPDVAARHIERKAAHVASAEDLRKFYDPNRGLAPQKQRKPPETSAELAFASSRAAADVLRGRPEPEE